MIRSLSLLFTGGTLALTSILLRPGWPALALAVFGLAMIIVAHVLMPPDPY